jgi:hypothetical protein
LCAFNTPRFIAFLGPLLAGVMIAKSGGYGRAATLISKVLANGFFNGRRVGLEVAVKNTTRPDGKTTPWAYYNFTDQSDRAKVLASATAFPDAACANCHQRHASTDNVWVQFYPTLRDRR